MSSFILKLPFTCDDYCERAFLREHAYVPTSSYVHWQACSTYVHFSTRVCVATCILVRGWRHLFSFLTVGTKVKLNCLCVLWPSSESAHRPSCFAFPKPSLTFSSLVPGGRLTVLARLPWPWDGSKQRELGVVPSSTNTPKLPSTTYIFYALFYGLLHSPQVIDLLTPWVDYTKRGPWALQGATRPILTDFLSD